MAERRMFSRTVTGSARFLMLSPEARLLYYDLGMAADDDGCVEAFPVIRMTENSMDALRELMDGGFLTPLTDDFVCYINHWRRNNLIRQDRYHAGLYKALVQELERQGALDPCIFG